MARVSAASHYMSVDAAADLLVEAHGDAKAHKEAWLGQQRARRARSRKRFTFWSAVAAKIEERRANSSLRSTAE